MIKILIYNQYFLLGISGVDLQGYLRYTVNMVFKKITLGTIFVNYRVIKVGVLRTHLSA